MHYTGWLNDFDDLDGKFDSSYDRRRPLTFAVGTGRVIRGWDEAILTDMKVGKPDTMRPVACNRQVSIVRWDPTRHHSS